MSAYSVEQERGVERLPHQVTVTLLDGRTLWAERLHAKGAIADPITEAERRSKFADCLAWAGLQDDRLFSTLETPNL